MAEQTVRNEKYHISRVVYEGLREIVGQAGVNAVLNLTGQMERFHTAQLQQKNLLRAPGFEDLSSVQSALEALYGPRGGRGVALRAARAAFKYFLEQYEEEMGFTSLDYRLLPTPAKVKTGLQAMNEVFAQIGASQGEISEDQDAYYWKVEKCTWCRGRHVGVHGQGVCPFLAGMLQEFVSWASSGRIFSVYETECKAEGASACIFRIDKKPLD